MDALALRCWVEMRQRGISPCVVLSALNDRRFAASCEVDVGNAVAMYALNHASGEPAACLDWNNNYGDEENKCILFHCGPVPQSLMTARGKVEEHAILANSVGKGCSYGCNVGRIRPMPFTFASMTTDAGEVKFYLGEGRFTEDAIPAEFFGCGGVASACAATCCTAWAGAGHRHHVSIAGQPDGPVCGALDYYLGFDVATPQAER